MKPSKSNTDANASFLVASGQAHLKELFCVYTLYSLLLVLLFQSLLYCILLYQLLFSPQQLSPCTLSLASLDPAFQFPYPPQSSPPWPPAIRPSLQSIRGALYRAGWIAQKAPEVWMTSGNLKGDPQLNEALECKELRLIVGILKVWWIQYGFFFSPRAISRPIQSTKVAYLRPAP